MGRAGREILKVLAAGALLGAPGCDNGPSAVETRDRSGEAAASTPASAPAGAPTWTSNRRFTAEENMARLYTRNGADFGASSAQDYAARAHAFIADPPATAETARRANGDTLYYDRVSNTFLVADHGGVPRTMFKPLDGPAYWTQQKALAAEGFREDQAAP